MLEASQIKAYARRNILLKDDKGYSYIKVTRELWPRLSFVLQKEEDDAEYLAPTPPPLQPGRWQRPPWRRPFAAALLQALPTGHRSGRPCLNAHIGKCMAACSGKISCENHVIRP